MHINCLFIEFTSITNVRLRYCVALTSNNLEKKYSLHFIKFYKIKNISKCLNTFNLVHPPPISRPRNNVLPRRPLPAVPEVPQNRLSRVRFNSAPVGTFQPANLQRAASLPRADPIEEARNMWGKKLGLFQIVLQPTYLSKSLIVIRTYLVVICNSNTLH